MPYEVGKAVDDAVSIFTFSIGAGAAGTCQMLNGYDLIGAFDTFKPKFAKRYGNVVDVAVKAFEEFAAEVRSGAFPDADHSYKMKAEEAQKLADALAASKGKRHDTGRDSCLSRASSRKRSANNILSKAMSALKVSYRKMSLPRCRP